MKKSTALIIIDVQNGMYSDPDNPVFQGEKLIRVIKRLLEKARMKNIPIIFIQHNGEKGSPLEKYSYGWQIRSEITPFNSDILIQKTTPNSFKDTKLDEILKESNINHLIICGLQSELCIDTTCRQASALGYKITLVKDGHSTFNSDILPAEKIIAHHNNLLQDWFVNIKYSKEILHEML
jgi:nicotinamidase-related amidase